MENNSLQQHTTAYNIPQNHRYRQNPNPQHTQGNVNSLINLSNIAQEELSQGEYTLIMATKQTNQAGKQKTMTWRTNTDTNNKETRDTQLGAQREGKEKGKREEPDNPSDKNTAETETRQTETDTKEEERGKGRVEDKTGEEETRETVGKNDAREQEKGETMAEGANGYTPGGDRSRFGQGWGAALRTHEMGLRGAASGGGPNRDDPAKKGLTSGGGMSRSDLGGARRSWSPREHREWPPLVRGRTGTGP